MQFHAKLGLSLALEKALSILDVIISMQKPICSHFLALLCMVTLQSYEKMIYA